MPFQLNPDTAKAEQLCDLSMGNTSFPLHSDASKLCSPALWRAQDKTDLEADYLYPLKA